MHIIVRKLRVFVCVAAVALVAAPARAITFGVPDGNAHPNVGALLVYGREFCSGTLISPSVFLTAAHCTAFLEEEDRPAVITFDPVIDESSPTHLGTIYTHPDFNQRQSDPHDIAVVVLDPPIVGVVTANLPPLGLLDDLAAQGELATQRFDAVGYGLQEPMFGGGPITFGPAGTRMKSTSSFNALTAAWLRLSQNPAKDDGGTCFGDSGGPNFLWGTDIIASITIRGDAICRATNVTYRVDTASARAFLGQFVPLP